jgi:hypothetical protein
MEEGDSVAAPGGVVGTSGSPETKSVNKKGVFWQPPFGPWGACYSYVCVKSRWKAPAELLEGDLLDSIVN